MKLLKYIVILTVLNMKGICSPVHLTVHNISFKFCRWYDVSILCSYAVAKSCLILCDSMDCSMTFFCVLHYFLEFLKFTSIESVMLFNHLILCCPLLLCLQFFPCRVFSNGSTLHIRWPKYWSFKFSISPSNEYRVNSL